MPAPCFNPRAPRGARPDTFADYEVTGGFQSTRPMRGATPYAYNTGVYGWFQSTRPMRGATLVALVLRLSKAVSIHAPHAGRD